MERKTMDNPMGYEPVGKLLKKFAVPSVIAMLVNSIYNIVDQIFIGQGISEMPLQPWLCPLLLLLLP